MKTISFKLEKLESKGYSLEKILKMLPYRITHQHHYNYLEISKDKYDYNFCYCLSPFWKGIAKEISHEDPVEAAGKLLVWCVEEGHVKVRKP